MKKPRPADPSQLDLGASAKRADDVSIVRNILVDEVTIILLPNMHQTYDDAKGAVRARAATLAPRIVDLCERRLRGLPACGVCGDSGEFCSLCGLPEGDHGEGSKCARWNASICEACPFPELQRK